MAILSKTAPGAWQREMGNLFQNKFLYLWQRRTTMSVQFSSVCLKKLFLLPPIIGNRYTVKLILGYNNIYIMLQLIVRIFKIKCCHVIRFDWSDLDIRKLYDMKRIENRNHQAVLIWDRISLKPQASVGLECPSDLKSKLWLSNIPKSFVVLPWFINALQTFEMILVLQFKLWSWLWGTGLKTKYWKVIMFQQKSSE